jgi:hypothetical protein
MAAKRKPRSPEQIAAGTPSAVAVAAFLRSGAGKHGKSGRSRTRFERQSTRRQLRQGDWQ